MKTSTVNPEMHSEGQESMTQEQRHGEVGEQKYNPQPNSTVMCKERTSKRKEERQETHRFIAYFAHCHNPEQTDNRDG
jgi:hypothetical protein